jgi:hypothetical protein
LKFKRAGRDTKVSISNDSIAKGGISMPRWVLPALVIMLVAQTWMVLHFFSSRYVDEDQAVLWYAAEEYGVFKFHEPYFYGQRYVLMLESMVGAPLLGAGMPHRTALPLASVILGLTPWFALAAVARARGYLLMAAAALAIPLMMPVEYTMILTMPKGMVPGIFIISAAVCLLLYAGGRGWTTFLFGACSIVAFSANPNSMLITVPAAVYIFIENRSNRAFYLYAGAGLACGGLLHFMAQYFYILHPGYTMHVPWPAGFSLGQFTDAMWRLDDFWGDLSPFPGRQGAATALVLLILLALAGATRRLNVFLPVFAGAFFTGFSLGVPMVHDGTTSVFLPYSRMYLALPLELFLFAWLMRDSFAGAFSSRRRAAGILLVVLPLICLCYKAATLGGTIEKAVNRPVSAVSPHRTDELAKYCGEMLELGRRHGATLVVNTSDRTFAYGCGALLHGGMDTLMPDYERRTWRLVDESARTRKALLLSDVGDDFCNTPRQFLEKCEMVHRDPAVALLQFGEASAVGICRKLGLPVRNF